MKKGIEQSSLEESSITFVWGLLWKTNISHKNIKLIYLETYLLLDNKLASGC